MAEEISPELSDRIQQQVVLYMKHYYHGSQLKSGDLLATHDEYLRRIETLKQAMADPKTLISQFHGAVNDGSALYKENVKSQLLTQIGENLKLFYKWDRYRQDLEYLKHQVELTAELKLLTNIQERTFLTRIKNQRALIFSQMASLGFQLKWILSNYEDHLIVSEKTFKVKYPELAKKIVKVERFTDLFDVTTYPYMNADVIKEVNNAMDRLEDTRGQSYLDDEGER